MSETRICKACGVKKNLMEIRCPTRQKEGKAYKTIWNCNCLHPGDILCNCGNPCSPMF